MGNLPIAGNEGPEKVNGTCNVSQAIAIVGMACRWPGGVVDPPGLWDLLQAKKTGYRDFGDHRFHQDGFHHESPDRAGAFPTRGAFLLDEDPRLFDHAFFGISGPEVETMDPSQRKLLEVVYEAFENAGVTWDKFSGSNTGVFVANFTSDHLIMQCRDAEFTRPYAATGTESSILSNRISYIFNLSGPSVTLNTACSSSMYALHLAASAIRNGDCDSAIVAASNVILDPSTQLFLARLGVLSPSSTSHTFDASADGYARGEGFAAIYLTRVPTALDNGYPIRSIVTATAINANGRTGGITHPSQVGQEAVIRKAYRFAGLSFDDTTYFECHGTGTAVGDPIEVSALANIFPSTPTNPLFLGSVKPNLGHTEAASALASIMKVVLSLEAGLMPPNVGIKTLNPALNLRGGALRPLTELTPWPNHRLLRASINSFGYGGANGHCIIDHVNNLLPGYKTSTPRIPHVEPRVALLQDMPRARLCLDGHEDHLYTDSERSRLTKSSYRDDSRQGESDTESRYPVVLPFSARNDTSLQLNIDAFREVIERHPLKDMAYTLSERRTRFNRRTFRIIGGHGNTNALGVPESVYDSNSEIFGLAFVFTGQGAQWHLMGSQLLNYHIFRATVQFADHILQALRTPPPWKLQEVIEGKHESNMINLPEVSQTACTVIQIGLVNLLASWWVVPSSVIGHSSGEIAAAYAAGRLSDAEAVLAAYIRGQSVARNEQKGLMLAVGLSREQLEQRVPGFDALVDLAAVNSAESITVSGDSGHIKTISGRLDELGVFNRILRTGGNAYHSRHMRSLGKWYERELSDVLKSTQQGSRVKYHAADHPVRWISSTTAQTFSQDFEPDSSYWRLNQESPVRFSDAMTRLLETDSIGVIVEIGPHPALRGSIAQIVTASGQAIPHAASLRRHENDQTRVLKLAGELFCRNAKINLDIVNTSRRLDAGGHGNVRRTVALDLPPYQYSYGPINYHESRLSKDFRSRREIRHDLLGSKVPGTTRLQPQWRNILQVNDLPWLREHRLASHIVFPAAAYVVMAVEAALRANREFPREEAEAKGVSLRNVSFSSALRIPDDSHGIEIVTSMTSAGPGSKNTDWSRFSISSVTREPEHWTEHCCGLVRIEHSIATMSFHDLPVIREGRLVDRDTWYERFEQLGLSYGPRFQGLTSIQADPYLNIATAMIRPRPSEANGESDYAIHPASLDALYQLAAISCHGGRPDVIGTAFIPIYIDRIYLGFGGSGGYHVATCQGELRGLRGAHVKLQMRNQSGQVLLDVKKLRMVAYNEAPTTAVNLRNRFTTPFCRLVWRPDICLLSNDQARRRFRPPQVNINNSHLFEVFERLAATMVVEIHHRWALDERVSPVSQNVQQFLSWVRRQVQSEGQFFVEPNSYTPAQRIRLIEQLVKDYSHYPDVVLAWRLFSAMDEIMHDRKSGLDVVVPDGVLASMYETGVIMTGAYPQLARLVDLLGHASPDMNILEIGAGTGAATRVVLDALLVETNGMKRYNQYMFTDISSGFFPAARGALANHSALDFSVLDIEADPYQQGFERIYDVVIASQCLHATSNIASALDNCHKLIKPGGKLIILENTRALVGHGLALGTLTGYWSGIADGRVESPFLSLEGWRISLETASFSGIDIVLDDYPAPYTTACTIVSTAKERYLNGSDESCNVSPRLNVVQVSGEHDLPMRFLKELQNRRVAYKIMTLQDLNTETLAPGSRFVLLVEKEGFLAAPDDASFNAFKHVVRSARSLVCVCSSGLMSGKSPNGAIMTGLLRTLGTENPSMKLLSIDVDPEEDLGSEELWSAVMEKEAALQTQSITSGPPVDTELAWRDGCFWTSRYVPDTALCARQILSEMPPSQIQMLPFGRQGPVRAAFETPGLLTSLYFKPDLEASCPLPNDYIQVKVAAIGLNWKDLATTSGHFETNNLSTEFAGTVEVVGSSVGAFRPGDRVYGLGKGHFGNFVRVHMRLAQRLQPQDCFESVATMPVVYATAVYAFENLARLQMGESVLIQSATGGLGLAAIQLARAIGAEVYAMAGTPQKVEYLRNTVGLDPGHVFNSADIDSIGPLLHGRGIQGFNVILGTAAGDTMRRTLELLAPLGRYVDVGRTDVQDSKFLDLELLRQGAAFFSFDLADLLEGKVPLAGDLMTSVERHLRAGHIAPIAPLSTYHVSQLSQALLRFSKGTHLGKLVVTYDDPNTLVRMVPAVPRAFFNPEAHYLVTGGLQGLGRSIIRWMAGRGARLLTILSRSGAAFQSPEAESLIRDLRSDGVTIRCVRCDVSKSDEVADAVEEAVCLGPLKGVVHTAVSYQDLTFERLTAEQWRSGLAAKVLGTQHLHDSTRGLALDFFVMTTSIETVVALATQSAYAAANNYQEHFARYRRRLGLPASTVSFGVVTDFGRFSTSATTLGLMERNKVLGVTEHRFLQHLEAAFLDTGTGTGDDELWLGAVDDPLSAANLVTSLDPAAMAAAEQARQHQGGTRGIQPRWHTDARVSLVMRALQDATAHLEGAERDMQPNGGAGGGGGGGDSETAELRARFRAAVEAGHRTDAEALVQGAVVRTVATLSSVDTAQVSAGESVARYGVDSLVAAELRSWFARAFGADVGMLDLLDSRTTIGMVARAIVERAIGEAA
ncbi:polyketide synthase [Xylariaceae sp. FL0804]|nr:polyketide synthase [Xylariaceae sp. FL0804]